MLSIKSLDRKVSASNSLCCAALLTLSAGAIVGLPEAAKAIDLKFDQPVQTTNIANVLNALGPGYSGSVINYLNVAPGVDARVTATTFGANYSFVGHLPNYSQLTAGEPAGDSGFVYQIAGGQTGLGGMNYKIDFFQGGGTFSTAYVAANARFLVYDVDGEASQGEAVRIAKNAGLVGYQVGNSANALIPTEDATSYLFSGRDANVAETDSSGGTILYFQDVSSVNFQFEANTRSLVNSNPNPVFSAIDGDLSMIGQNTITGWSTLTDTSSTAGLTSGSTAVPEPFSVIGTMVGGTAAMRMRKKLKATSEK